MLLHCDYLVFNAVIYAISGGAAVSVLLLLALVAVLMKKVKSQRKKLELTNEEITEFLLGVPREKASVKGINDLFVLPYDTKLEVVRSDVTFRKSSNATT